MNNKRTSFRLTLIALLSLTALNGSHAQNEGIQFFEGSIEEAFQEADDQGKLVFISAHDRWCGANKYMFTIIFPKKEIGDFFNDHFINIKLDMRESEHQDFTAVSDLEHFPVQLFMNASQEVVIMKKGVLSKDNLLNLGEEATQKALQRTE